MNRTPLPRTDPQTSSLHRNVWVIGFTSLFTDISSEMIYPLLAPFLVLTLGAKPAQLGLIEGLAESTAALLRVFSGWFSDRIGRRKPVTWAGYGLSSIGKLLLYLAGSWSTVLFARLLERTGKGIRTAPRDALVSDSVPFAERGHAFGVRTAMDFLGGMIGVGLAYLLARHFLNGEGGITDVAGVREVIAWALLPAGLALLFPALLREPARRTTKGAPLPRLSMKGFSPSLKTFVLAAVLFNLGNSSNQFLLLRSKDLLLDHQLSPTAALKTSILFYMLFKAVVTVLGVPLGRLSDRLGRKRLVIAGYLLYAAVYAVFATDPGSLGLWGAWALYGVYAALTDGLEKAMVSDLAPSEVRGTALGYYGTAVGISLLPASIVAGWLYQLWEPAPFLIGSFMATAAATVVGLGVKLNPPGPPADVWTPDGRVNGSPPDGGSG